MVLYCDVDVGDVITNGCNVVVSFETVWYKVVVFLDDEAWVTASVEEYANLFNRMTE